ncbi:hypothetical protein TNCV_3299971 [Trichonephila clavipes]|nr:hypothetical protein TNCV_3299971 [Trichonephila clavipes]
MRPLSGRSFVGQSGCNKNRDQKVREKISSNQRAPLPLRTLGISLAGGATVPLRDRSITDSCHLIDQAVSLPLAKLKVTIITNTLILRNWPASPLQLIRLMMCVIDLKQHGMSSPFLSSNPSSTLCLMTTSWLTTSFESGHMEISNLYLATDIASD